VNIVANGAAPRRAGLFIPAVLAFAAFTILAGFGMWQVERKAWKEALIENLDRRVNADPVALPPVDRWPGLSVAADEFRRVMFEATIDPAHEVLVYTVGSAVRPDVSGPGYWVFAPARLAGGGTVVLNRGYVADGQRQAARQVPADRVTLAGALRWPEERGLFVPKDDPGRSLWFVRDHITMARAKGWGEVAPFYVELETPSGEGPGMPRSGRMKASLRNDHLQYALTWFGLAVVLVFVFGFWVRSRMRGASSI
jgi:surfeit locus 1 family protein